MIPLLQRLLWRLRNYSRHPRPALPRFHTSEGSTAGRYMEFDALRRYAIRDLVWTILIRSEKLPGIMDGRNEHLDPVEDSDRQSINGPITTTHHLRNHLLWMGPLLTFAGAVSYFMVFARFPVLRDFPWLNLPLVLGGMLLAFLSARRAFDRASVYRGKVIGSIGFLLSLLIGGAFCWYVFIYSYTVPPPKTLTLQMETAPEFELPDQDGRRVRLSDFRGRHVVLTFHRGFW